MLGLGSAGTIGLGLVVSLRDQFTGNAGRVNQAMAGLTAGAKNLLRNNSLALAGIGVGMTGMGLAITRSMAGATNEAAQFENTLRSLKAMAGDMTDNEMRRLGEQAWGLSRKYNFGPQQIAKGMEELVKASLKADQIPKVMEAALASALAASENLEGEEGVAARLVDIMMAWQIPAEDAMKVADLMNKTAIESTVSWNQLAESMKYSQDILHSLKIPMEDALALLGLLGNAGIKASIAGTSIGNMFREITEAAGGKSRKKNKALKELGLTPEDLRDATGNLKPLLPLLGLLESRMRGLNTVDKQNILQDLFGTRGKRGANPALDNLVDFMAKGGTASKMGHSLTESRDILLNAVGATNQINAEKMQTYVNQMGLLKNAIVELKIAAGETLISIMIRGVQLLTKVAHVLTDIVKNPVGKFIVGTTFLMGALLIPIGAMITLTGALGLSMTMLSVNMKTLGQTARWVWQTLGVSGGLRGLATAMSTGGIARALKAMWGVLSGTMAVNGAGRVVRTIARAGQPMVFASTQGTLMRALTMFATGLRFILPYLGWAGIAFGVLKMAGFKVTDMLLLVTNALKSLWNGLMNLVDLVTNPWNMLTGNGHFRNAHGFDYDTIEIDKPGMRGGKYEKEEDENMMRVIQRNQNNNATSKPISLTINIPDIGYRVTALVNEHQENNLTAQYGLNS